MLALVAGEGELPGVLIAALDKAARPFRLCELEGHPCADRGNRPVMRFRLETLGTFLDDLVRYETTEICFAGRIDRPGFDPRKIDAATQPLIPDLMKALSAGDDSALRHVMRLFEARRIAVVAPQDIAPTLLPAPGVLTTAQPNDTARADATRGIEIIAAMGQADVGQACVVAGGQALAIETMQGTDLMLATLTEVDHPFDAEAALLDFARKRMAAAKGGTSSETRMPKGGVLIKAAKPGQDRRIDLPTIGPDTIRRASRARLSGIVVEAGGVFILDPAKCAETADTLGLFLWVRE